MIRPLLHFRSFVLLSITLVCFHNIQAATVMLEAVDDATLYQDAEGDAANSLGRGMFAGRTAAAQLRRGLLKFDLAAILSGAVITSVSLSMHVTRESANSPATPITLHQVLTAWTEGTSAAGHDRDGAGVTAETGDPTWLHSSYSTLHWASAGGDYDIASSASTLVDSTGHYLWSDADMITDVQQWVGAPAQNYGWLFMGNESTNRTARRFATHEELVAANRPMLTVTYEAVPEPERMLLFFAGILPLIFRRRHAAQ